MVILDRPAATPAETQSKLENQQKSAWGQFYTPVAVARKMASMLPTPAATDRAIRILDPGAGAGILGIAAAESLLVSSDNAKVHLVAVEAEPNALKQLLANLDAAARQFGDRLTYKVIEGDFLQFAEASLLRAPEPLFDLAISNPPYFKMSPKQKLGGDAPNAYARFFEVSLELLRPEGTQVFIIPRSFAAGYYYKKFRRRIHKRASLQEVHVFESRRDVFIHDEVLQESVIVAYKKTKTWPKGIAIGGSWGTNDLEQSTTLYAPMSLVRNPLDPGEVLSFPTTAQELEVLNRVRAWPDRLQSIDLAVSTGPVVAFRTKQHLVHEANAPNCVPLLWMNHVHPNELSYPLPPKFKKAQSISASAPAKLLVPRQNCVLLRRFSPKEDSQRLTVAALLKEQFQHEYIGLENHLNFIHSPFGSMNSCLALGITKLLSSQLMDSYFRISSGNTQVSATELRNMPLPSRKSLEALGSSAITVDQLP